MSTTVIHGEGLGKRYRRGLQVDYGLRHSLEAFLRSPIASLRRKKEEMFWALKDVSLQVNEGEVLGLIGRNGAGKTTLLKILSRITRPTEGWAEIHGRVGSLLEVGTGFHPELTGRENTFLSGAILGMSTRDISARFDEIVAFSEIAPFIDMPVKHYSSGMYARLGFAVAAFLKPDILIVDEILAVGDLSFQAKCLAHMRGLPKNGTTVLFVSHNLLGMADLCPRAMVLADGHLEFDGPTSEAVGIYRQLLAMPRATNAAVLGRPSHELRINGRPVEASIESGPNERLLVELDVDEPPETLPAGIELNLVIETSDGRKAIHLRNDLDGTLLRIGPGRNTLAIEIEDLALVP